MHYLKRISRKNGEEAVSPVVGVMLMLVVTIIIAAVVSGFAGGLISGGNNQKAPTLAMDVKISNSGSWVGSGFSSTVTSVSEPILTKNIKIVTSWTTTMKDNTNYPSVANGASFAGGNTSLPLTNNSIFQGPGQGSSKKNWIAPFGAGPGITGTVNPTSPGANQQFGNYTLTTGTGLYALPFGTTSGASIGGVNVTSAIEGYGVATPFAYNTTGMYYTVDATQAVLGANWEQLRAGDIVTVRVIHIPTGKVILQKDVAVTEG